VSVASETYEFVDRFPFETSDPDAPRVEKTGARSTCEALALVRFQEDSDLAAERAYEGCAPERVFLVRRELDAPGGPRGVILLVPAGSGRPDEVAAAEPIGILRPVQRYVVTAGLARAEEIEEKVLQAWPHERDPWGFVRVRTGDAPKPVSVTPPIVEELPVAELEAVDALPEFILCDGTHRVVQQVWRKADPLPAIAMRPPPRHPYYARPVGRFEWEATSDNELNVTPDRPSKYLARPVELEDLDTAAQAKLGRLPEGEHYRRWFRDLETGFGPMGGQGGRYV
jgi:hypothetical protein